MVVGLKVKATQGSSFLLITALGNCQQRQSVTLFCVLAVLERVFYALVVRAVVAASIFRHLSSYAFSGLVVK